MKSEKGGLMEILVSNLHHLTKTYKYSNF